MSGPGHAAGVGRLVEEPGGGGRVSLVSPKLRALGVPHGFTTRRGVGSGGVGDPGVASAADLAGFLADAGLAGAAAFLGRQVHGVRVSRPGDRDTPADAHFGGPGGGVVAVRTADCLAVLLVGPAGVVAAHAGWRGLLAGVLEASVDALGGTDRVEAVAIGPAIGAEAFEIGPEVAAAFRAAGHPNRVHPGRGDRSHVDLLGVALDRLGAAGVPRARVDAAGRCTHAEPDRFFSYRRDGPGRGHQAAWIRPPRRRA